MTLVDAHRVAGVVAFVGVAGAILCGAITLLALVADASEGATERLLAGSVLGTVIAVLGGIAVVGIEMIR